MRLLTRNATLTDSFTSACSIVRFRIGIPICKRATHYPADIRTSEQARAYAYRTPVIIRACIRRNTLASTLMYECGWCARVTTKHMCPTAQLQYIREAMDTRQSMQIPLPGLRTFFASFIMLLPHNDVIVCQCIHIRVHLQYQYSTRTRTRMHKYTITPTRVRIHTDAITPIRMHAYIYSRIHKYTLTCMDLLLHVHTRMVCANGMVCARKHTHVCLRMMRTHSHEHILCGSISMRAEGHMGPLTRRQGVYSAVT